MVWFVGSLVWNIVKIDILLLGMLKSVCSEGVACSPAECCSRLRVYAAVSPFWVSSKENIFINSRARDHMGVS